MDEQPTVEHQVWEAPNKRFTKTITSKGFGFYCPQDGSVCKIKVNSDEAKILSEVNEDLIKELIVGDVDDPIDRLLEACVRTMKNEEICILKFPDPSQPIKIEEFPSSSSEPLPGGITPTEGVDLENLENMTSVLDAGSQSPLEAKKVSAEESCVDGQSNDCIQMSCNDGCSESNASLSAEKSADEKPEIQSVPNIESCESTKSPQTEEDNVDSEQCDGTTPINYEVHLQLLCYTREPEIWEMSITEKWRRANYHKQKGMELYARGSYEWAFRRFGLSLKYIISLEHDVPSGQEEGMNIAGLKLSCYLNLAACQMRHYNYTSVVTNCTKALEIQSDNSKALYRRGSAYTQLQEYEKAKEDLDKALELEPKNQAITKQQQILKARVQKLNDYYSSVMKKMFL